MLYIHARTYKTPTFLAVEVSLLARIRSSCAQSPDALEARLLC